MSVNEQRDIWGGIANMFSLGQDRAICKRFATEDNDVRWLLGILREGKRNQIEEALKLLESAFKSDTLKTLAFILENQSIPILLNIVLFNSNPTAKNHALAVLLSLSQLEDFKQIAAKEGVVGMLVEGMGCCNRANSVSIGEILMNLLDSSPVLVEEFVLVDGLGHAVKWVDHSDRRLRTLGLNLLLTVSQERDDFKALMAVEGCIPAVLALLDCASPKDPDKASLLLANISYNYDVRNALANMVTIRVLLKILTKGYESAELNVLTIFANLSVLPKARKMMKNANVVSGVANLLEDSNAEVCSMATCFMSNMAVDTSGRILIKESGVIPMLINLLKSDNKRLAAHALGNLVQDKDLARTVTETCGIEQFVDMLRNDDEISREEAVRILSKLCIHELVQEDIIRLRVPCHLVDLFSDKIANTRRLAMVGLAALAKNNQFTSSSFIKECVAGVVDLLNDEPLECRHQACLTLSSLVNGSSEVGSVAIEHYAVDKLLSILKDERDLLTLARPHVAVCLHSLSRDNKSVLQTIAEANVIPRLNEVIHGSGTETKMIVSELVTNLAELLSPSKKVSGPDCSSAEVNTATSDSSEGKPAFLGSIHSSKQETAVSPLTKESIEKHNEEDNYLQVLANWYSSNHLDDALSDADITLASMMPRRLLSAIAQELVISEKNR